MSSRAAVLILVPWLLGQVSCVRPATQLVVVVDTDLEAGTQYRCIGVRVSAIDDDGAGTREFFSVPEDVEPPFSFGITPPDGDPSGRVEVAVEALRTCTEPSSTDRVVRRAVRTGFLRHQSLRLPMFLSRGCGDGCLVTETCPAMGSMCTSIPTIEPSDLSPATRGSELEDAGRTDAAASATPRITTFDTSLSPSLDASDLSGLSVSLSADGMTLVVGAPSEDGSGTGIDPPVDEAASESGAAYVYRRSGDSWLLEATLKADNTGMGDQFGNSLAVSADGATVVVAAYTESGGMPGVNPVSDEGAYASGAAYVFTRTSGVWRQQARLKASNPGMDDSFGTTVAISGDGDAVAIGAYGEDGAGEGIDPPADEALFGSGAVYVYRRSAGLWAFEAYVKAVTPSLADAFGCTVALDATGATLAVGARQEDGSGLGVGPVRDEAAESSGAAYVYRRSEGSWAFDTYIKPSNTSALDGFGYSLALSADGRVLAVGAPREAGSGSGVDPASDESLGGSGAAYVYRFDGAEWSFESYLKAWSPGSEDQHGWAVALSADGSTVAVGSRFEDGSGFGVGPAVDEAAADTGSVHVYRHVAGIWTFEAYVKASEPTDSFGVAVALDGDGGTLAVGTSAGSTYLYR